MDIADELTKLHELKDRGILSPEEFEQQKARLLERAAAAPPAPATLGAYDLFESAGEGGMGRVFRGRHRVPPIAARQGGDVAVKILHAHLAAQPGWVARFRHEAEALAALDHPHIVKVHDVVEESGKLALVMEWVPGQTLADKIGRQTGPLPWDQAQGLASQLLDAVAHAHARGVVHRDLKPANVRLTPEGVLKVLDFGIARVGEASGRTQTGTGMGTIDYMAPEQYTNAKGVDHRADVYALGMTLYEMVAGRLPWEPTDTEFGVMQRKHEGNLPPPTAFYPSIPPRVVDAIVAAVRADPAARPQSVDELRRSLMGEGPPVAAAPARAVPVAPVAPVAVSPPAPVLTAPPPPARSNGLLMLALGAVGATLLLWAAWESPEPGAAVPPPPPPPPALRGPTREEWHAKGMQAQVAGRTDTAIEAYEACLRLDPNYAPCHWEIGWSYWVRKDWPTVVRHWHIVRSLDPNYPELDQYLPRAEANLRK